MGNTNNEVELRRMLEQRLIESGEKEELQDLLRTGLVESGWKDQVKNQCRDIIQTKGVTNTTVNDLLQELAPKARASVPDDLKETILLRLKTFLLTNLKELEDQSS
ncbi:Transcription and mRNA export factor eny2 [Dispira simplex]|nr:Transcription and mRNA export factor eny2 [Dispira simplex]